jgi:hypothetical protein
MTYLSETRDVIAALERVAAEAAEALEVIPTEAETPLALAGVNAIKAALHDAALISKNLKARLTAEVSAVDPEFDLNAEPDPALFDESEVRPEIIREDVPFGQQQEELLAELRDMNNLIQMGRRVDQNRYDRVHAGVQWLRKHIELAG